MRPRTRTITTPEQVEVRLTIAGLGRRLLALLVDALIWMGLSSVLAFLILPVLPPGTGYAVWLTLNFVLAWGYHAGFELAHEGRTPGKRLLGLRVVDRRGLPLSEGQAFVRNIVRIVDALPAFYGLGGFAAQLDAEHRRLGDTVASTLVVREDVHADVGVWAIPRAAYNSLRVPGVIRRLQHRVTQEEREFIVSLCLRADELDPEARFDLFEDVGSYYRRVLGVEESDMSGENLVRGLAGLLHWDRRARLRAG